MNIEDTRITSPKVSIIIPIYNVGRYLNETLQSAVVQTLQDIEIIPVDDGSTDDCPDIIAAFAGQDSRIRPIRKQNGGYGSAVNAGIHAARGDYILILEGDDQLVDDIAYILWHTAKDHDLDICRYNAYFETRDFFAPRLKYTYYPGDHNILSTRQLAEMFACGHPGITLALYRRSLLVNQNVTVSEDSPVFVDVDFVVRAYLAAKRIKIVATAGYLYRRDVPGQSVNNAANALCIVEAAERIMGLLPGLSASSPRLRAGIAGYTASHLFRNMQRLLTTEPGSPALEILTKTLVILSALEQKVTISDVLRDDFIVNLFDAIEFIPEPVAPDESGLKKLDDLIISNNCDMARLVAFFYLRLGLYFSEHAINHNNPQILRDIARMFVEFTRPKNRFVIWLLKNHILPRCDYLEFIREHGHAFTGIMAYLLESGEDDFVRSLRCALPLAPGMLQDITAYPRLVEKIDSVIPDGFLHSTGYLWRKIKKNEENFLACLTGKSIAVVGNSPCETGKGKGSEIDEHDIVIRFNNYSLAAEYRSDYGSKESIWCISPNFKSIYLRHDLAKYDFIVSLELQLSCLRPEKYKYIQWLIDANMPFTMIDGRYALRYDANIHIISAGMYIMDYLLKHRGRLGKVNTYGFAFTDIPTTGSRHYFAGDPVPTSKLLFHNWEREAMYFAKLKKALM